MHCAICILLCSCMAVSHARQLSQAAPQSMNQPISEAGITAAAPAGITAGAKFPTFADALATAKNSTNLSTFAAAATAAESALAASGEAPSTAAWTFLAPTNKAFTKRLKQDLQITPEQLLQNKTLLVEVRRESAVLQHAKVQCSRCCCMLSCLQPITSLTVSKSDPGPLSGWEPAVICVDANHSE